ncbi:hypothetical protein C2845_PM13G06340 [Panicum miliaceum]|uniref:NB-ARC domain-containing protein n=1 Tax=Panicum miliaceum TaxID=4540 RepID=A0A3L6RK29_PANMI|nr:hypothetical protein C2845_PM13G06340 [Panicum miliaceum]
MEDGKETNGCFLVRNHFYPFLTPGSGGANAVFIDKVSLFTKTLRAHLDTPKQIRELKAHLKEINEQPKQFGDYVSRSGSVSVNRLPALYRNEANLVGVEGPREDIMKFLTDTDQQLKVLSIVGFGGLGKPTLAKEVYRKIGGQFDVMAFVSFPKTRYKKTFLWYTIRIWDEGISLNFRC